MKLQLQQRQFEQKQFQQVLMKKHTDCKTKKFYILLVFFINYYSIINSCWHLLLSNKISSKTKTILPYK